MLGQESNQVSRFRRLASQLCVVFAYNCLKFVVGSFIGFHVILIAELHKKNSEIVVTLDQLTWIASFNFLGPFYTIASGLLSQRFGSRKVLFVSMLVFIASWLLFHYATNATTILVARLLSATLSVHAIMSTYITEISEAHLRGRFLLTSRLALVFGMFFSMLLGSMMYWQNIALVNLLFPTIGALLLLVVPDSPVWLASRRRFDEAEKSLCWVRGWVKPIDVQTEFRSLVDSVNKVASSSDKHELDKKKTSWHERSRQFFQPFLQRSFYLPFGMISLVFILFNLSGDVTIYNFSGVIFEKIDSPIDESVAIAITGGAKVIGVFISILLISRIGKRKLMFFSLVVAIFCHVLVAGVGYFNLRSDYPWISLVAVIFSIFSNAVGINNIVYMLNSEIFPLSIRYIGSSMGNAVDTVVLGTMNKSFLYAIEMITLSGVFLFFAVTNFVTLVTCYFIIPETEGRSLKEIEDHFTGIKNSDDREK